MDRDEILKKAQAGAIGMDEREQQVLGLSFGIGGILMVFMGVLMFTGRMNAVTGYLSQFQALFGW